MRASYAATVTGFPHPAVTPGAPHPSRRWRPRAAVWAWGSLASPSTTQVAVGVGCEGGAAALP